MVWNVKFIKYKENKLIDICVWCAWSAATHRRSSEPISCKILHYIFNFSFFAVLERNSRISYRHHSLLIPINFYLKDSLVTVSFWKIYRLFHRGIPLLENNESSAKLTTANGGTFTWAHRDSVANHVTARSIGDWRALTWLATATGWTWRKRSAICSGKLIRVHMIWYDMSRRCGIEQMDCVKLFGVDFLWACWASTECL